MKKILILFIIFGHAVLFAQSAGSTGLSFLKIGFGARNIAMGDLGVVTANDVTALNYNPALISRYNGTQLFVTHNELISDTRSELFGSGFELFGIPLALGINTTTVSDIEVRTRPGEAQSTFNANYFYTSLSTGFDLADSISVGFTAKYLYENLFSDEANGWGFDFGLFYSNIIKNVDFGASLKNIGSMNELRNEATELPVDLRVGLAYNTFVSAIDSKVILLSGVQKYTATDDTHIHFGTEILYKNYFALRGGYFTGYESKSFTAGIGLIWNDLNFDYAYTPFDFDLGTSHTISILYNL
ncbi:MAG: PorV/PorQ family protein [Ignavibacteria bacterium]|jgi:hypothetical protein